MHPGIHAEDAATRPAIVMAGSGRVVTYAELDAGANRIARVLRAAGLRPGDHVAFCMENDARFLELAWGARYAGLLYTACSTRLTAEELAYVVDDCSARAFVASARVAETAERIVPDTPAVELRASLGGAIPGHEQLETLLEGHPGTPLEGPGTAGADMLYSSGTTGRPKGIKPRSLTDPLETPTLITPILERVLGFGSGDVYLSPAPLYHAAPMRFCMGVHQLGGTTIVMERFDAGELLDLVACRRVTHAQLVPTMFVRLLRLPPERRAAADLTSLRSVVHAGAPCPPEVKRQMIDWWGPIIHEYYSSTEGSGLTWCTSEEWLEHPGSVGRAVVGRQHIADEEGRELPAGETGAVWFSDGPDFEYHDDPEKTAAAHDERGWSTFGDIGRVDEDGFLYLTDRAAHTIITGGVNVYPQEAEDVLLGHPAVLDAAVFGIPNPEWGEEVKAVVQPVSMPSNGDSPGLEAELMAHCRSHLADVKCPRSIDFRAELPRHDTGKLYKRLLKAEYEGLDISARDFWAQPYEQRDRVFARFREECPISWHRPYESELMPPDESTRGFYSVWKYDDIRSVSRNARLFCSGQGMLMEDFPEVVATMSQSFLCMDDPEHARLRALVSQAFSPRRMRTIESWVRENAVVLVDEMAPLGEGDFCELFAKQLPGRIFANFFGLPRGEVRGDVMDAAEKMLAWDDPGVARGRDALEVYAEEAQRLLDVCFELVDERRAQPGEDLISWLVEAELDGRRLEDWEIGAFFTLLAAAANDTTRHSTAHALHLLTTHPDQRALLLEDLDGRLETCVEEVLRHATPVMHFRRTATEDTELRGVPIAAGEKVVMWYCSGNRDEQVFDDPARFDVLRAENKHLGFGGGGPHYCMGSALGRLMLKHGLRELLTRLPDIEAGPPDLQVNNFIHGVHALPATWTPVAGG